MNALSEWLLEHPDADPRNIGHDLDLESYAQLLGGEVDGDFILCPSPGRPADDRSCYVRINKDGRPYIYDVEGSLGAAYAYVRERLKLAPPRPGRDYTRAALDILSETVPAAGTLVERYLRKRALTLPIPACLHFHPSLWHSGDKANWPGMVAERADVEGYVFAIHRTYIAHDGRGKANVDPVRMDLGRCEGSAIRLAPIADEMMIGEGIETTLSAMQMYRLPGWAAGSAPMLRKLSLPAAVRSVILLVDNDSAGENASWEAAQRWLGEGRRVRIARSKAGNDFNDWLMEIARAIS
jgi:Toprim domain